MLRQPYGRLHLAFYRLCGFGRMSSGLQGFSVFLPIAKVPFSKA